MSKYYPDISHYHPVRDWDKVKKNCPFLIAKATQGTSYIDDTLYTNIRECEKRGIPYWLYAFLNRGDEEAQTRFLVETCREKIEKHFVGYVLDVESGNAEDNVEKALEYLKKQRHKMMLYTMYSEYSTYKRIIQKRPQKCAWWEARYGLNNGIYQSQYRAHRGADLQQFTSNGRCPGIPGRVDLNRITGYGKKEKWFRDSEKRT